MAAEMGGELERALDEMRLARVDRLPRGLETVAGRLQIHFLLIGGRADEAVEVARRLLARSNDRVVLYLWAISRWMAGEPSDLVALGRPQVDVPALNSRDEFVRRTLVASMLASTGRRDEVHRLVEGRGGTHVTGELTNTRDAVLDVVARALCAVVDRDEAHAARLVAGVAAAHARQPDPGSAPAPVPADRLRARPRAARPLGRRHAGAGAPQGAGPEPPPGRPPRRSSRRARRRRPGARVHGAAVGVVDRAGLPPACRPAPERSAPRRMARRPGSCTGAGRAAPPGGTRVRRHQESGERSARAPPGGTVAAGRDQRPRPDAGRVRRGGGRRVGASAGAGPHAARAARGPREAQP